jgi:hypothetical protein
MKVEDATSNKWRAATGVWIEQFATPAAPDGVTTDVQQYGNSLPSAGAAMEAAIEQKYNLQIAVPGTTPDASAAPTPPSPAVNNVFLVCRAIKGPDASLNTELMYAVLDALKASPIVDPKATVMGERPVTDDSQYTFTFAVKVALKNPLKF